jgi:hypothetical protein
MEVHTQKLGNEKLRIEMSRLMSTNKTVTVSEHPRAKFERLLSFLVFGFRSLLLFYHAQHLLGMLTVIRFSHENAVTVHQERKREED